MTNEIIGILGVISLTFLLFVLRHFILTSERGNKNRYVGPTAPREYYDLNESAVESDPWLLWTPDVVTEARVDDRHRREPWVRRQEK